MSSKEKFERHKLLIRCEECFNLVQGFLSDSLPWSPLPKKKPLYQYNKSLRKTVKDKVLKSIEVLEHSIDSHGLEEIAMSYNGGKDCLVMLVILLATIHKKISNNRKDLTEIPADYKLDSIYINSELPFPQLADFIERSTRHYHLNPIIIKSSLKEGFETYLNKVNTKVKAIVVGIRHSDPYGSQLHYEQMTDHNWPKFLRIHPILHWNYVDVWDFLIGCDLGYCEMYDLGYTSLGGKESTMRNPCLRIEGTDNYLPAYMLSEKADERERLGRNVN